MTMVHGPLPERIPGNMSTRQAYHFFIFSFFVGQEILRVAGAPTFPVLKVSSASSLA
jgi:hypothetical protein